VVKVVGHKAHIDGSVILARWRQCAPHLIHVCLGPPESTFKGISIGQPILDSSQQRVHILYNGPPLFSRKTAHSHGGSGSYLIHGSLGPPESTTTVTDRLTDRHTARPSYSICNNRPHLYVVLA